MSELCLRFRFAVKGKYHANLLSFQNQKCSSAETMFVINYYPSAIKLLISASGQRQKLELKLEKC